LTIKKNKSKGLKEKEKEKSKPRPKKDEAQQKERHERVYKVTLLLADVNYPSQQAREEAILSYCRSSLTITEINNLVEPLRPENIKELKNKPSGVGVY